MARHALAGMKSNSDHLVEIDVNTETRLDKTLFAQRSFLASVAEAVGEGVLVENDQGECVFANQEAAKLLGCTAEDLLGRKLHGEIVQSLGPVDFDNGDAPSD